MRREHFNNYQAISSVSTGTNNQLAIISHQGKKKAVSNRIELYIKSKAERYVVVCSLSFFKWSLMNSGGFFGWLVKWQELGCIPWFSLDKQATLKGATEKALAF